MAQRLLYKIAVSLGAVGPRLDDTAQRLTWKIVSVLWVAGSDPRFAPRLDDTLQWLLWKWASLLFVSHGGDPKNQPFADDLEQRLLWKIANMVALGGDFGCCAPSESQRLLYDIATALQKAPVITPSPAPIPCTLPSAPGDMGASAGSGQVTLTWPAGTGATGYRIYRSPAPGMGPWILVGVSATSPFVDQAVVNGTQYFYQVSSTNACGESVPSIVESHATPVA